MTESKQQFSPRHPQSRTAKCKQVMNLLNYVFVSVKMENVSASEQCAGARLFIRS